MLRFPSTLTPRAVAAIVCALLLGAGAASASSFVMTTDDELLGRSAVVVLARVTASEAAPIAGKPHTDTTIEIERLIKGFVPAGTLTVRTLGGVRADGVALRVSGAPVFVPGERVLLFLNGHEDSTYRVSEMALGAFHELTTPGRSFAVRSLIGSHTVQLPNDPRGAERRRSHEPRDLNRFADWLAERAAGSQKAPDYFTELPQSSLFSATSPFALTMSNPCGAGGVIPLRWPEFDRGDRIRHLANSGGQPGVPGGGFAEIQAALNVWERDSGSNVDLTYGGTTSGNSIGTVDGRNIYTFEDPDGDIDGSYTGGGGTLAVNFVFFSCFDQHRWSNGRAENIQEAGTTTQDGTGANFFGSSATPSLVFAEVMAHETGHSLGLAHSALASALMNATVHDDGRGASLTSDDRAGIRFLYPRASASPPTAPSGLTALAVSTSTITVSWTDNSSDEDSFELQEADLVSDFATIQVLPAGTTTVDITGLAPSTYRRYRVRAVNGDGESEFSSEAEATTSTSPSTCSVDANTLCLNGGRFAVTTSWQTTQGSSGMGTAVGLTGDTGYFTFFSASNVEAVVKVLDACSFANRFWVFAGGLTDVLVALQVTDTASGRVNTYLNPQGTPFQPIQDVQAFDTCP